MFTGLVEGQTHVLSLMRDADPATNMARLVLARPDIEIAPSDIGMSYAIDGTCLTLVEYDDNQMTFDLISSTLDKTRLGRLNIGAAVNWEQSAKIGDRNGGHELSGHVDCTANVTSVEMMGTSRQITFTLPAALMRYVFAQGFVSINGASLTIASLNKDAGTFCVWIIPETAAVTNIGSLEAGNIVNIEFDRKTQVVVDSIAHAVTQYLTSAAPHDMGQLMRDLNLDQDGSK
jgi:riboflavin synthase